MLEVKKLAQQKLLFVKEIIEKFQIFFFLNKAEYIAQENIATTIHKSPLLKLSCSKIAKLAFVIITITPKSEKITPNI